MKSSQIPGIVSLAIPWMLSTAAIALRLLARRVTKTRLWWDDWMALSTYVSSIPGLAEREHRWLTDLDRAAGMGSREQCLWHQVYVTFRQAAHPLPNPIGMRLAVADLSAWFVGVCDGLALHRAEISWMTPSQSLKAARMNLFFLGIFYALAVGFAKIAVLALYWRMFSLGRLRYPIIVLTVCSALWTVIRVRAFTTNPLPSVEKYPL